MTACRKSRSSPDTSAITCRRLISRSSSARSSSPTRPIAGQFRKSGEPYITHPLAVASILSQWRLDAQGLAAALLHDVMEDTAITKIGDRDVVRQARRRHGRRRLQARPDRVHVARGRAGRELPQDAARDGAGRARHPDQARRPAAQHAHARRDGAAAPPAHRARDARHLRADREPPRPQRALPRAAGPRVQAPLSDALPDPRQRDQGGARQPARGDEPAARRDPRRLRQGGHHRGRLGAREDDLLGLQEDGREALHVLAGVRHLRRARAGARTRPPATPRSARCTASTSRSPASSRTTSRSRRRTATSRCTRRCSARSARRSRRRSARTTCTGSPRRASPRTGSTSRAGELDLAQAQRETHRWLQSLLEIQSESRDSKEFLENIKGDLFPDEIYVFTPKGKIMALPRGATAVDFGYAVHTDVGHHCVAARINYELMPLRTELKNGDHVEILTSPTARPNPSWLSFVATGKARSRIRHFLKGLQQKESAALGERLLDQALATLQGRAGDDHLGALGGAAEGVRREEPARHPRRHRARQAAVVRRRAGADAPGRKGGRRRERRSGGDPPSRRR